MIKGNEQLSQSVTKGNKLKKFGVTSAMMGTLALGACSSDQDYSRDLRSIACEIVEDAGPGRVEVLNGERASVSLVNNDVQNGRGEPTDASFTAFFPYDSENTQNPSAKSLCDVIQNPDSEVSVLFANMPDSGDTKAASVIEVSIDGKTSNTDGSLTRQQRSEIRRVKDAFEDFKRVKGE